MACWRRFWATSYGLTEYVHAWQSYLSDAQDEDTPMGLIYFTALLLKFNFVGLRDLLPFVWPSTTWRIPYLTTR